MWNRAYDRYCSGVRWPHRSWKSAPSKSKTLQAPLKRSIVEPGKNAIWSYWLSEAIAEPIWELCAGVVASRREGRDHFQKKAER